MIKPICFILITVGILYACDNNEELNYSAKEKNELTKDVQTFFSMVKDENGVHLYNDEENDSIIVYLNGFNVKQGDEAEFFTNFKVEADGSTLNLFYDTDTTTDYSSPIDNQLYYEVKPDKDYDVIRIFNNSDETYFETASGNTD
ncbi:hypothetical protein P6709_13700 [Jeotgalibacillus sp. ET6]|uniref:hypothetical protein n=1 Tax=Jeotgalibacillus sp. ET6 TaxID=3037260 RepID=UPI0024189B26|nr:hypothetical protein [Jeotgalibacillus sp. ET6]MDG5472807.1 hypothetical protein [Jeotgalibacillus sp. ET6]